jgi:hypothetical protein
MSGNTIMRALLLASTTLLWSPAMGQSVPTLPAPVTRETLLPTFATKADTTNGKLSNPAVTGGTFSGPAITGGTINGKAPTDPTLIGLLNANETLNVCQVGCAYPTVRSAWNVAISRARFGGVVSTIHIADGTYTETDQFYTDSPAGKFVHIVGNTTDNSRVVINFTNIGGTGLGGFIVSAGGRIGLIDGVTLNGVGAISGSTVSNMTGNETATGTVWNAQSYGAGIGAAGTGSLITLGAHVRVNHFYYGLFADNNGMVDAEQGGVTATDSGDVNMMARGNGVIICTPCTVNRAADTTHTSVAMLGSGFDAERGGTLYIDGSTSVNSYHACINALTNGAAWAHDIKCSGGLNGQGYGFQVTEGGFIETFGTTGSTVTGYTTGIYVGAGSGMDVTDAKVSANSGDGIVVDGGRLTGSGASSTGNTGYGLHLFHQGNAVLFSTLRTSPATRPAMCRSSLPGR